MMTKSFFSLYDINFFYKILDMKSINFISDLEYHNFYTLLVAVVLSSQSTDKGVNNVTKSLFNIVSSPQEMVDLGVDNIRGYIRNIGLFNKKASNIFTLSQQLIDRHGGKVPNSRKDLENLSGVGRKTSNVVLNIAFSKPTIGVDTHIFRVCNRTGLSPGKSVVEVEDKLMCITPKKFLLKAHRVLIFFGRYICSAKKPKCQICFISHICKYKNKHFF